MFSLRHLDFEGRFKDREHNPAPADVQEGFIVYLCEEEQAGVSAARRGVKFGTTLRRCNLLFQSPQTPTEQGRLEALAGGPVLRK